MKDWRVITAAVALGIILLVAHTPAALVTKLLPPQVKLDGVSGTVWEGEAARARWQATNGDVYLGHLQWKLSFWSLVTFEPAVALATEWGPQQIAMTAVLLGGRGLSLRNVDVSIDARLLRKFAPLFIGGQINLDATELRWENDAFVTASGRALWERAVWTSYRGDVPLGTYAMDFEMQGQQIVSKVITIEGQLQAEGMLSLSEKQYTVDLQLSGPAVNQEGLRDSFKLFGVETAEGFKVDLEGAI